MIGPTELRLLVEGKLLNLHHHLGAHREEGDGEPTMVFTVWAPRARAIDVVGDWNQWAPKADPLAPVGSSGVWTRSVAPARAGHRYRFSITGPDGTVTEHADPVAFRAQRAPETASIVTAPSEYPWADQAWIAARSLDPQGQPLSVYELHLGSWRPNRFAGSSDPTYRSVAEPLAAYVADLGFTHVELLPVMAHPFGGSWGYQVTSYFAPAPRWGEPDDLRFLVDTLHRAGIGVIADWVPAHFPKDPWALARFDGTPTYEHADPRRGDHPDWGTHIFDYGRGGVRSFLLSNARYWLEEFHFDGLRVDAVASMLYLDYSRAEGEWLPNVDGGPENLEAVSLLRELNRSLPEGGGAMTIAEESTAWPGVSGAIESGGLGFGFKWNLGWMNDTLKYFSRDPVHRRHHHDELTFGLHYAFAENFVLPLSHDEVVHEKRSLLAKMPGDRPQQLANLRALYGWMWAHPGKQLLFMGGELAQEREWDHDGYLDWELLDDPAHAAVQRLIRDLNAAYRTRPAFWALDTDPVGFSWLAADDADHNTASFLRHGPAGEVLACIANLSQVSREQAIGLPRQGSWRQVLNTDAALYGGSGVDDFSTIEANGPAAQGQRTSITLRLAPLSVVWLEPVP